MTDNKGEQYFIDGWYCSEAVVKALAERTGLPEDKVVAMATGLSAGMARSGRTCGALTGAILAVSAVTGRRSTEDSVEDTFAAVQELMDRFIAEHGGTDCTALLDCDLSTTEGRQRFKDQGLKSRCQAFTATATRLAEQILNEEDNL